MDYLTYKLIHLIGFGVLFMGLGSIFTKYSKAGAIGHGVGLFLILLGGFGMQAKMKAAYVAQSGSSFPNWMIAKIVIWFIFGAAIVLAKRGVLKGATAWVVMVGLAAVAAYLGIYKPF